MSDLMFSPVIVIPFLLMWLVVVSKPILFWIYLWQLKEYHVGRFLDHFRTTKGKKLLFNAPALFKFFFVLIFVALYVEYLRNPSGSFLSVIFFFTIITLFLLVLFPLYCVQCIKTIKDYFNRNIKKPVFTLKATIIFLATGLLSSLIFFLIFTDEPFLLIVYDLLIPVIVSAIVLIFQPFFVVARNRILKKAKKKISGFKNLTVIGITGSYGKTSTKEFLTTILSEKFNVLATPEHKNSEIGIAQTILEELNENHEIFIVEMGAYKKNGIKLLCDITKPRIGIVTGVNEQHLALFGSMENLLSAEGGRELFNCLPKNGFIALNGDNKNCLNLYKEILLKSGEENSGTIIYATQRNKIEADIWIEDLMVEKEKISFVVRSKEKEMMGFSAAVSGGHNAQNLLGAILVARKLGMDFAEISAACVNIKPEQGGMILKKGVFGTSVIDSSYSSNIDGVIADLDYLKTFEGKKVVVMPCLIELGTKSAETHIQIGKKIAQVCDLAIITTKDKFTEIKNGATENEMSPDKIVFSESSEEIFNLITTLCKEGDAVLLEGRVPSELVKLLIQK